MIFVWFFFSDAENQFLVSQFDELYEDGIFDIYIGISGETCVQSHQKYAHVGSYMLLNMAFIFMSPEQEIQ